ncbi:vesicle-associated protein 2-2-like [Lotus japonicus]|uniref:vesicle-associated protein 2-2-like n=1 Tax=Lotus japonicus TaxID=34305 RepID=UPI002588F494|nr:vesicle-associated protein 2-2-like [Lotus japonicus]XP_057424203.1 vesicle-associated protein 2-2-like [Lotus japonicus]
MNKAPILNIQPRELQFIFELKKQSTCSVQLTNNTYHYVAFKVKTTSPKKYSVRPNVGVLAPKSSCEFIVTMQAQRVAPEDMVCKDKFLIQSTFVPAETTSEDVTSTLFVKDASRYIEENKLKVALISPPDSPDFSHTSGESKNGLDHEKVQIYSKDEIQSPEAMVKGNFVDAWDLKKVENNIVHEVKLEDDMELKPEHDTVLETINDVGMPEEETGLKVSKDEELNTVKDVEELKPQKELELEVSKDLDSITVKNAEELKPGKEAEFKVSRDPDLNKINREEELKPGKDVELKVSKDLDLNTINREEELKPGKDVELKVSKDLDLNTINSAAELKPEEESELNVSKDLEEFNTVKNVQELKPEKEAGLRVSKGIEELKLMEAIEEMKLKLDGLEAKLNESGITISKLTEERRLNNQEAKILQQKLDDLINKGPRKVQVGFPFLYVCMVALICVFLGYRLHS